jgi:hypothetical protein
VGVTGGENGDSMKIIAISEICELPVGISSYLKAKSFNRRLFFYKQALPKMLPHIPVRLSAHFY